MRAWLHEWRGERSVFFECPGCKCSHRVIVMKRSGSESPTWEWNGSLERPEISPSILVHQSEAQPRCHSFVLGGRIQFLGDCTHALAGQTVDLPEVED